MNVLLVDDDAEVCRTVALLLRAEGHSVIEATSGAEALEILERSADSVDFVLTDLRMPGIDGWELVRAASAIRPSLKLGIMLGTPGFPTEHRMWVDVIIDKPVRLDALRRALASFE